MSHAYYTTTADPSRAESNHWSNAPEGCPVCGSTNCFTAKKRKYNFMTKKFENTEIIVCREYWHKTEI